MKPLPEQHKRVRLAFEEVADGYGGDRKIRGLPGLWQIVAADPVPTPWYAQWPAYHGMIMLIVAFARGSK